MPKALLLGQGLETYRDALTSTKDFDASLISAASGRGLPLDADLLIVEPSFDGLPSSLPQHYLDVPKLVICPEGRPHGLSSWIGKPHTYMLQNPTPSELLRFSRKILSEHAIVAENRHLRDENASTRREIGFIDEINKLLTTSRDTHAALSAIARKLCATVKAQAWSVFCLPNGPEGYMDRLGDRKPKKPARIRLAGTESIAGLVSRTAEPILVADASVDKHFSARIDASDRRKIRTLMAAPIKSGNKCTTAVVELMNKQGGEPFSEEDFTLFKRLTAHASAAIDQIALYQRLEDLVVTDDLTNLFNSRYLNRSIETEILRSNRYSTSVSLIFMDVDHFKDVNDNFGHLVGSKVLVEMGGLLMELLRTIDIIARYGGDEFVIVLPQTTLHNAMLIAERIRKSIESHTFMRSEGLALRITASFGVAAYPESSKSKEALLKLADEAMYSVKRRTRNAVYAII